LQKVIHLSEENLKIRVLPETLINKIAAGEVIDRPSSVVKELVENSIDAVSTQITVIVKGGGSSLIQVVDNGSGMEEQDAIMAFQRHATSKIQAYRDLEHITTLGFRGEALASIASVSRVEMKTLRQNSLEGTAILLEGGIMQKVDRTGGNTGTSMAVKNLFFNTPARRKFLRAESTEYRHILSVLNHFTLAFPNISFILVNEGNEIFNLRPADFKTRISEVMGSRVGNNLIEVHDESALLSISGFVGNFDMLRKSRNDQYLFLNGRYISDRTLNYAITSAFGNTIPKGNYPLYIIFLRIDPERVDVNVHPTKSEVKFADQRMLYELVRSAVKRALTTDNIIPEMQKHRQIALEDLNRRFQSSLADDMRNFSSQQARMDFDRPVSLAPSFPGHSEQGLTPPAQSPSVPSFAISPPQQENLMVWQLQNKYILSQIKSGLVVIDQHAAHERILYERAKKNFTEHSASSQQLLFPQTVELAPEDFEFLMEISPLLEKIGFIIKSFGSRTVVVEGVPSGMRIESEDKILLEILDEYKVNLGSEVNMQERVAKSYACRSAIMAGDKLSIGAMNALIDELFSTENPYFCPHGRPVILTISTDELDQRFERK